MKFLTALTTLFAIFLKAMMPFPCAFSTSTGALGGRRFDQCSIPALDRIEPSVRRFLGKKIFGTLVYGAV